MKRFRVFSAAFACLVAAIAAACSSSSDGGKGGGDAGAPVPPVTTTGKIEHVVVIVQENHTFDAYFGNYCKAAAGSNPTCTTGPDCCEAAPATEPSGSAPVVLDDAQNGGADPNHAADCETAEINGGKMDHF